MSEALKHPIQTVHKLGKLLDHPFKTTTDYLGHKIHDNLPPGVKAMEQVGKAMNSKGADSTLHLLKAAEWAVIAGAGKSKKGGKTSI